MRNTGLNNFPLKLLISMIFVSVLSCAAAAQPNNDADKGWINQSNEYTNMLLSIQLEHSPEQGSAQGVARYDERISDPSLADEKVERRELEAALAKIKAAPGADKHGKEDIVILQKAFNLQFRQQDFALAHEVPLLNASAIGF